VGKPLMTGTFYVYDDEQLARKQVNPTIFARLDKARKKAEEAQAAEQEAEEATKEGAAEATEAAAEEPAGEKG